MAVAAAQHYRVADNLTGGDPADIQNSIAESLCGLLALGLSHYADSPHDDFDDDDEYVSSVEMPHDPIGRIMPREESDEDRERAYEQEHGKEPEVIDPYSIHRAMQRYERYDAGISPDTDVVRFGLAPDGRPPFAVIDDGYDPPPLRGHSNG